MSKSQYAMCLLLASLLGQETNSLPAVSQFSYSNYEKETRVKRQDGCNEGELRISEGTPNHGYLEYCLNNEFGIVCGDSFDDKDAQVACRQLGYAGDNATGVGEYQGRSDEANMYLSFIQCSGDESTLSDCPVPGGPELGIFWNFRFYCSWRASTSNDYVWDYNVARINCVTSVTATAIPPKTLKPGIVSAIVEQVETTTLDLIMNSQTLSTIRITEPVEAVAQLQAVSLESTMPLIVSAYLLGDVIERISDSDLSESALLQLLMEIISLGSSLIENAEANEDNQVIVGSSLLSILDIIALKFFSETSNFSTPNIVVQAQLLPINTSDYVTSITSEDFPERQHEMSIQLSPELLQLAGGFSRRSDGFVRAVSFLYYNVDNLFPSGKPGTNGSSLGSGIVSTGLQCGNAFCPTFNINLTNAVIITIEHSEEIKKKLVEDSSYFTECVFWNFLDHEISSNQLLSTGEWSDEGCSKNEELSSVSVTVCECSHLTHFAILLSPVNLDLSEEVVLSLEVITYVGTGVSVVAMVITIAMLVILKSQHNMRSYIHISLCINLMIAQLIFVLGSDKSEKDYVPIHCQVIAVLLHYFFLVSFMWMLMEGVVLYFILIQVFVTNTKKLIAGFTIASYGAPLLYMGALTLPLGFGLKDKYYGSTEVCFLNAKSHFIWAFIAPVVLIIIANIGFLIMAAIALWRQRKNQKRKMDRKSVTSWLKVLFLLVLIMGATWVFGILIVDQDLLPLIYIHAFLVAFQGVFIFLSTVAFQKPIRDEVLSCCKPSIKKSGRSSSTSTSVSVVSSTHTKIKNVGPQEELSLSLKNGSKTAHKDMSKPDKKINEGQSGLKVKVVGKKKLKS